MNRPSSTSLIITLVLLCGIGAVIVSQFAIPSHQSTPHLQVSTVGGNVTEHSVVAFENLTPGQQRVFERALTSESQLTSIPDTIDTDVWVENNYVRYQTKTYRVLVAVS